MFSQRFLHVCPINQGWAAGITGLAIQHDPLHIGGTDLHRLPRQAPRGAAGAWQTSWSKKSDEFIGLSLVIFWIPSGYVKIAIENGHRNSEFSH